MNRTNHRKYIKIIFAQARHTILHIVNYTTISFEKNHHNTAVHGKVNKKMNTKRS